MCVVESGREGRKEKGGSCCVVGEGEIKCNCLCGCGGKCKSVYG